MEQLNDCPNCKWCSKIIVNNCYCACPTALEFYYKSTGEIAISLLVAGHFHSGTFGCQFTPIDTDECNYACVIDGVTGCENGGKCVVPSSGTNQGRTTCFRCGTQTVKVDTGFYSVYDICPNCKV